MQCAVTDMLVDPFPGVASQLQFIAVEKKYTIVNGHIDINCQSQTLRPSQMQPTMATMIAFDFPLTHFRYIFHLEVR